MASILLVFFSIYKVDMLLSYRTEIDRDYTTDAERRAIRVGEVTNILDIIGTSRFVSESGGTFTNDSDEARRMNCDPQVIDHEVLEYFLREIEEAREHHRDGRLTFRYSCNCEYVEKVYAVDSLTGGFRLGKISDGWNESIIVHDTETHLVLERWGQGPPFTIVGAYVIHQRASLDAYYGPLAGWDRSIEQVLVLDSDFQLAAVVGPRVMEAVA